MGLPRDDGRELYKLTEIIHTSPEALPPGAGAEAVMKMFQYGAGLIAEKRARPGNDLATKLLQAEVDGQRLDDTEFLLFFLLLVDAGGDTTRNLLSAGLAGAAGKPGAARVAEGRSRGPPGVGARGTAALDEPVIYMRRTAKRDVELAGEQIREGDKVVMYFGAANRDPEKFDRPDTLDLARAPNEHIAFGAGPHGCLGQHIARIEIDAILLEVLTRMEDLSSAAAPEWLPSNFISGPKTMRVRFKAM